MKQNRAFRAILVCIVSGAFGFELQQIAVARSAKSHDEGIEMAVYNSIRNHWLRIIAAKAQDSAAQEYLLKQGEPALEVMLDLLYGPRQANPKREEVEKLVNALGSADFKSREAAQHRIESMGYGIAGILQEYAQHHDPEIAMRVKNVVSAAKELEFDPNLRRSALEPFTRILEVSWPPDQIRNVVRRNLDRLSSVETVEHHWGSNPLGPLLGSLRHSEDADDRELLISFVLQAKDGAAEVTLDLMPDGLSGRTRHDMQQYWKSVPQHDYSRAVWPLLDPSRPAVFKKAIYAAPRGQKLRTRLRDVAQSTTNSKLRSDIYTYLWHFMSDPVARDHYFDALESPDFKTFSTAVCRLTDCKFSYKGAEVIPKLRPALKGEDVKRRKLVLGRLDNYLGKTSVRLAAAEAAPFLASDDPEERKIARIVLLDLQGSGWVDVLQEVSGEHESEKIRAEAKKLYKEWQDSKKGK